MTILLLASCAAFAGAFLSACIGLGGGTLFIACLYLVFEPLEAIALHGLIQTVNNGARFFAFRQAAVFTVIRPFMMALLPAVAMGWVLLGMLDNTVLRGLLGGFVLLSLTTSLFHRMIPTPVGWFGIGFGATLSSMLVGAADPALAPFFLGKRFERRQIIATKAACQLATHLPKVALFASLGFEGQDPFPYQDYTGVLAAMLLSVLLGVMVGKKTQVNPSVFRRLYRGTLLVLGLKLLVWDALLAG